MRWMNNALLQKMIMHAAIVVASVNSEAKHKLISDIPLCQPLCVKCNVLSSLGMRLLCSKN